MTEYKYNFTFEPTATQGSRVKGIASRPEEKEGDNAPSFMETFYESLSSFFSSTDEAKRVLSSKKDEGVDVNAVYDEYEAGLSLKPEPVRTLEIVDDLGELARRSSEEAALLRQESGIVQSLGPKEVINEETEVMSTIDSTSDSGSTSKDEQESAPVTAETSGAGLMSPPVGDDAEGDFYGQGLPFSMGTTTEEGRPAVKETQSRLRQLGYYKNRVDGLTGKGTKSALKTFQYNNGLDVTGIADDSTRALLSQTSGLTAQPTPKTTLLKYISEGEGGYGAANNGTSKLAKKFSMSDGYFSDSVNKPLTGMSVNELMNAQVGTTGKTTEELLKMNPESTSAQNNREVFAVGAYQIIPKTMWSAVKSGAIEGDTIFSPETQDKIAMDFLAGSDRPKLRDFLAGNPNVSVEDAMLSLAQQWASAPAYKDMTTSGGRKIKKGDSYYGSGNKALHTVEETKTMLLKARDENVL